MGSRKEKKAKRRMTPSQKFQRKFEKEATKLDRKIKDKKPPKHILLSSDEFQQLIDEGSVGKKMSETEAIIIMRTVK